MFVEFATSLFLHLKLYPRSRIVSKLWPALAGGPLTTSGPQNADCSWYLRWKSRRIWELCFEFCPLVCLTWAMLHGHQMLGNGVSCLSPGSQERKGVGINLPASSLCARFPLKQMVLKQDTWDGRVTSYDKKCWPSCLIQMCLKGTELSLRSTNLCCQMSPLAEADSTITGRGSSQLCAKLQTILLDFKYHCLGIPDLWSYYRPLRPALLNSDPVFNHCAEIMAPQEQCLPRKITQPL